MRLSQSPNQVDVLYHKWDVDDMELPASDPLYHVGHHARCGIITDIQSRCHKCVACCNYDVREVDTHTCSPHCYCLITFFRRLQVLDDAAQVPRCIQIGTAKICVAKDPYPHNEFLLYRMGWGG